VIWEKRLKEVKKYIDKYNKRPSCMSKEQNIKKLGKWIYHQQENYKNKSFIMNNKEIRNKWEKFIEDYEKYFLSNKELWEKRFKEVKKYIDKYNKCPSCHDKKQNIKKLGYWISTQQKNYKNKNQIMKNKEIRNKWKKFVEEYGKYFMTNKEVWINTLKEVKKYINKYNKRPPESSKEQNIKKLGKWISNQLINYKNKSKIMSNKEIRKKWEKFIEEYKDYFN